MMKLEIVEVQNPEHNEHAVEKIFFRAQAGINLNHYLLYDATFTDEDNPSNIGRHVYRFPTYEVEKDCYIVLWIDKGARAGEPVVIEQKGKPSSNGHRFYWGRKAPVINNTGDNLTLIRIAESKTYNM